MKLSSLVSNTFPLVAKLAPLQIGPSRDMSRRGSGRPTTRMPSAYTHGYTPTCEGKKWATLQEEPRLRGLCFPHLSGWSVSSHNLSLGCASTTPLYVACPPPAHRPRPAPAAPGTETRFSAGKRRAVGTTRARPHCPALEISRGLSQTTPAPHDHTGVFKRTTHWDTVLCLS